MLHNYAKLDIRRLSDDPIPTLRVQVKDSIYRLDEDYPARMHFEYGVPGNIKYFDMEHIVDNPFEFMCPVDIWDDYPTSKEQKVWIQVYTHNFQYDEDKGESDYTLTLKEAEYTMPSADGVHCTVVNTGLPSKFSSVAIQGISKYQMNLTGWTAFGSYLRSADVGCNGQTFSFEYSNEDAIQNYHLLFNIDEVEDTGNIPVFLMSATDSRGFTRDSDHYVALNAVGDQGLVDVKSYDYPGLEAIIAYRCDNSGTKKRNGNRVKLEATAVYSKFNIANDNTCHIRFRVKERNGVFGGWYDLQFQGDSFSGLILANATQVTFEKEKSYTIEVQAIDDVDNGQNAPIYQLEIPTEVVPLHLGKGGKRISIGTYCSDGDPEEYFRCEWKSHFVDKMTTESDVEVGGEVTAQSIDSRGTITSHTFPVDVVTESGTSQNTKGTVWNYRKWLSGRMESWTTVEFSNVHLDETGGGKGYGYSFPTGTFNGYPTFSETPIISMNIIGNECIYPITKAIDVVNSTMDVRICSINDQYVSGKIQVYMQDSRILLPVG